MKTYELVPQDGRKSFWGKATVLVSKSATETLYSYGTPIIKRDKNGRLKRLYDGWSATTERHIKTFCGLNKAGFCAFPYAGALYN